jgi:hypothetical protein
MAVQSAPLLEQPMPICHQHNLNRPVPPEVRPYGIRISLRRSDPFSNLLGEDWQRLHWYGTAQERDAALADMSRRHEYSRIGDQPSLVYEKVESLSERLQR